MKFSPLLILFVLAIPPSAFSSPAATKSVQRDGRRVTVTVRLNIAAQPNTKFVVLNVLIPQSIAGGQKIHDIQYSPKPVNVFAKGGNAYAQFVIRKPGRNYGIAIRMTAEVYRYDLTTALKNGAHRHFEEGSALGQWRIHEHYLPRYSPNIQVVAKRLKDIDARKTARNCFDYVVKNLKRRPYDDKDYGAEWALQHKRGDCTEYADLFVTLCRANGIPARFCEGYLLEPVPDTPKHDWAEVYFQKLGWIPFDPFYTYLGKATTFENMRPVYLRLDVQRRNSVLNNHHFYSFRYEGSGPVRIRDTVSIKRLPKQKGR